jgi:hypothetical protein
VTGAAAAVFRRIEDFDQEEFEDDLVVMNRETKAVVTLNPTARVMWDALAEQVSVDVVAGLFAEVFPDADGDAIRRDIEATLAALLDAELVTEAHAGA